LANGDSLFTRFENGDSDLGSFSAAVGTSFPNLANGDSTLFSVVDCDSFPKLANGDSALFSVVDCDSFPNLAKGDSLFPRFENGEL